MCLDVGLGYIPMCLGLLALSKVTQFYGNVVLFSLSVCVDLPAKLTKRDQAFSLGLFFHGSIKYRRSP